LFSFIFANGIRGKGNAPFVDSSLHFPEVSGQAVSLRMTDDCGFWKGLAGGEAASQTLPSTNLYKALSF